MSGFLRIIPALAVLCIALIPDAVVAHVTSTDCTLQLVADRNKVTAELCVPIPGILIYTAAERGSDIPDRTDNPVDLAAKVADDVLQGLVIYADETALAPKLLGSTVRTLPVSGQSLPAAIYSIEYTADQQNPTPGEITVEQNLLPIAKELLLDRVTVCFVKFRQADRATVQSQMLFQNERATFKCQWSPSVSHSGDRPILSATRPAAPAPISAQAVATMFYVYAGAAAAIAASAGVGVILVRRRAR